MVIIDGRRARGDASRRLVLEHATQLASVDGLDGVTIGALAVESGRSKSSIVTLFGDKQQLQLATIEAAAEVFRAHVVEPSRAHPHGAIRVAALLAAMLAYSRDRVFAGGCFFAAASADLDSKPGPVADALRAWMHRWYDYVEHQIRLAVDAGELDASTDAEGLGFELIALAEAANLRSLLSGDDRAYRLAASAIRARLAACGAPSASLAPLG